jgi:hypothetical protein
LREAIGPLVCPVQRELVKAISAIMQRGAIENAALKRDGWSPNLMGLEQSSISR